MNERGLSNKGLNTSEIAQIALRLVGLSELPLDSGIHVAGENIHRLLFAMDVNVGLLHTAKETGFDGVLGHHPIGVLYDRGEVYRRHIDLLELHGVPRAQSISALENFIDRTVRRMKNARFRMLPYESPNQTVLEVDVARFLNLPLLNVHNPCDELGRRLLQAKIDEAYSANPGWKIRDVLSLINSLPEAGYARSVFGISPLIYVGGEDVPANKTVFVHGALSAPGTPIINYYWENGFSTVVMLHGDFETLETLRENPKGNLILTGHYLGDSLGTTPYLRALRKHGLEVVCMGGIIDVEGQTE